MVKDWLAFHSQILQYPPTAVCFFFSFPLRFSSLSCCLFRFAAACLNLPWDMLYSIGSMSDGFTVTLNPRAASAIFLTRASATWNFITVFCLSTLAHSLSTSGELFNCFWQWQKYLPKCNEEELCLPWNLSYKRCYLVDKLSSKPLIKCKTMYSHYTLCDIT